MSEINTTPQIPVATDSASATPKPPQTIGGGHVIMRRSAKDGSFRPHVIRPYEHASLEEAAAQAQALAAKHGGEFVVLAQVGSARMPERPKGPAQTPPKPKPPKAAPAPAALAKPDTAPAAAPRIVEVVRAGRPVLGIRKDA